MADNPVAVGAIGGSGTRIVAGFLQQLGMYIGDELSPPLDNLWYALLFGRRDVFMDPPERLDALIALFFRQMSNPRPLTRDEEALVDELSAQDRIQHKRGNLKVWAKSLRERAETGKTAPDWGWKTPYTWLLADRLLAAHPSLRYVHVTRNGPDMAFSSNQNQLAKWGPVLLNRDVEIGPRDALAFWCECHRRVNRMTERFPDRIYHLDYDRLLDRPRDEIAKLFAFLGRDLDNETLDGFAAQIEPPETVGRAAAHDPSVFDPDDLAYARNPPAPAAPDKAALEDRLIAVRAMPPGSPKHYRAYVGPPGQYDFMGATQVRLLTALGLREEHRLLDIGCGSLRAGRYFIQYLLPDRYIGIEPNDWLWRQALQTEIGQDVARIKRPRFLSDPQFTTEDLGGKVDAIVAQSIYSHTGEDAFRASLNCAAEALNPNGQFLFTAIMPGQNGTATMPRGVESSGWIYPGCVSYGESSVVAIAALAGFKIQRLPWFHPRQTWFRATLDAPRLDDEMLAALGNGKPLFDERFA